MLSLERVPKMLGALRHRWCPSAMVVSFKLETDQHILLQKVGGSGGVLTCSGGAAAMLCCAAADCSAALFAIFLLSHALLNGRCWLQAYGAVEAYGVQLVVANELHSRKDRVWLVSRQQGGTSSKDGASSGSGAGGSGGGMAVQQIERPGDTPVIETLLVAQVVAAHRRHMQHPA